MPDPLPSGGRGMPPPPREWEAQARCRVVDPDVFFPPFEVETTGQRHAREARAKEVCADCPVLVVCRDWALAAAEPHGVWGGLSESERREVLYRQVAS